MSPEVGFNDFSRLVLRGIVHLVVAPVEPADPSITGTLGSVRWQGMLRDFNCCTAYWQIRKSGVSRQRSGWRRRNDIQSFVFVDSPEGRVRRGRRLYAMRALT